MSQSSNRVTTLPSLLVSRKVAEQRINEQVEAGNQLRNQKIDSREALNAAYLDREKWSDLNFEILRRFFDDDSIASTSMPRRSPIRGLMTLEGDVQAFRDYMDESIAPLDSILARLSLIPERTQQSIEEYNPSTSTKIFIVHGHDELAKESVARFIEKIGLEAIVLHEQPNAGRTIIEKFEDYSNVGFAVVLLTPDDIGSPKDKRNESQPRSRQNVILELGYFMGRLGRGRVCALYKEGVEIPSDYQDLR
jgi:hypothetical protein